MIIKTIGKRIQVIDLFENDDEKYLIFNQKLIDEKLVKK
jgi:hypothetical protein